MAELKIIYTTVANREEGVNLAKTLVHEHLVACGNVLPKMKAIYRWKGTIREEEEVAVIFKTSAAKAPAAMARICELHSYDIPAVEIWAVEDAPEPFRKWVLEETSD
ncbi:MAG: divalent-cation tolerance protein CutA [Proteobacteria bacterium]|nr:divalent-cation tolerance protein CutA [Pseudomonadota bacterium]